MPIKECQIDGKQGWKWGDHGTCYLDRKDAERQASAAHANGYVGDGIALDSTVRTYDKDGRLHIGKSHISKAMVCDYLGVEIPGYQQLGLDPNRIYRLLRHPEELKKGAHTFARLPILSKHVPINSASIPKELIVGAIGSDVEFNAPYLDADTCFWTDEAIAGVETDTQREFSCAYHYVPVMQSGIYEGESYDGIMTEIRGNHLAQVEAGRAGPDVLAADEKMNISLDGNFNEGDHPRAANGEFGSGGSGSSSTGSKKDHPFVGSFLAEHGSSSKAKTYLESVPHEKLTVALKLAKGGDSPESKKVANLIEKELDSRADRGTSKGLGQDSKLEIRQMKMTRLGKALFVALGNVSPKLAMDAAFPAIVANATKTAFDKVAIRKALLALDAEASTEKMDAVMDALTDIDEPEPKEKKKVAEDEAHPEDCDCKDCKKMAKDKMAKDAEEEEKKKKEMEGAMDSKLLVFKQGLKDANDARNAVKPVLGETIASDSATEIYELALDQMKVAHTGVKELAGLKALYDFARTQTAEPVAIAQDAAGALVRFPGMSRIKTA